MNILIIEEDEKTAFFLIKGLKQEGMSVQHVKNYAEGFTCLRNGNYDCAIIDIVSHYRDDSSIRDFVAGGGIQTPVIIISAWREGEQYMRWVTDGTVAYVIKPFSLSELLAKIYDLITREQTEPDAQSLEVCGVHIDMLSRKAFRDGKEICLQPKEIILLEYLMRNAGRTVSKQMIMEHVWGYNFSPQTHVVETSIDVLSNKIQAGFGVKLIHDIRSIGYSFNNARER